MEKVFVILLIAFIALVVLNMIWTFLRWIFGGKEEPVEVRKAEEEPKRRGMSKHHQHSFNHHHHGGGGH